MKLIKILGIKCRKKSLNNLFKFMRNFATPSFPKRTFRQQTLQRLISILPLWAVIYSGIKFTSKQYFCYMLYIWPENFLWCFHFMPSRWLFLIICLFDTLIEISCFRLRHSHIKSIWNRPPGENFWTISFYAV